MTRLLIELHYGAIIKRNKDRYYGVILHDLPYLSIEGSSVLEAIQKASKIIEIELVDYIIKSNNRYKLPTNLLTDEYDVVVRHEIPHAELLLERIDGIKTLLINNQLLDKFRFGLNN